GTGLLDRPGRHDLEPGGVAVTAEERAEVAAAEVAGGEAASEQLPDALVVHRALLRNRRPIALPGVLAIPEEHFPDEVRERGVPVVSHAHAHVRPAEEREAPRSVRAESVLAVRDAPVRRWMLEDGPADVPLAGRPVDPGDLGRVRLDQHRADEVEDRLVADC